jgi:hypothetical protein
MNDTPNGIPEPESPGTSNEPVDLEAQNRADERRRRRLLKQSSEDLRRVLDNSAGLERLRDISDEEWDAAVAESEQKQNAA